MLGGSVYHRDSESDVVSMGEEDEGLYRRKLMN